VEYFWSTTLEKILITMCYTVIAVAAIVFLVWRYKSQLRGVKMILEHFALNLQNSRRNGTPALTD